MEDGRIKIIKASAGSGKTYNLARTFIAHLIGAPTGTTVRVNDKVYEQFTLHKELNYHRHLLAITFTNKATNEMKDRIIKELHLLSTGHGDYVNDFKIMFVGCTFSNVVDAARKALCSILFDYANFNVSTIDSFFQRVLRNFARELDHDYNYEVQLDHDYATSVAVHDFLLELGATGKKHAAINNWVKDFINNNINNNKDWNFFGKTNDLKTFAANIYKEFFRERQGEIVEYLDDIGNGETASKVERFKQKLLIARDKHKNGFEKSIERYHNFLSSSGVVADDLKSKVIISFFERTFTGFESSEENTLRGYATQSDALTKKVVRADARSKLKPGADESFQQLVQETVNHYDKWAIYESILKNIWNLGLLGKINEKLEQYRKDSNCILIADTNDLIGKALQSGAHFIYEHVGTQFNNYMIDEFQDTSKKQYSNFVPLLEETLSRGNDNLIIGDEKQSIYRFRNSDPSLLRDVIVNDFAGRFTPSTLDTNYRSYKSIVEFNNELFTAMVNDGEMSDNFPMLMKTYNNIAQKVHKSDKQGRVEVNFVPSIGGETLTREAIIKTLPGLINSMLERGYNMGDIAILVNTKDQGKEIIAEIMKFNESLNAGSQYRPIKVVSSESLRLDNSPSVKLILSALRFLELTQYHLPEDNDEALTEEFARFLDNRINEQRYYKILHDFMASLQKADASCEPGDILHECVERDRSDTKKLTKPEQMKQYGEITRELMPDKSAQLSNLVNVVDKIIAKYLLTGTTSLENSYIMAFVDVVHNFSRRHNGGTIAEFLQYWDSMSEKLTLGASGNVDAVNVMTIHKSKGLEFKCVIIPFANWQLDKMDEVCWIEKSQLIDNLNALESIKNIDHELIPPLVPIEYSKLKKTGFMTSLYDSECEKSVIDNVNKLYVALTRPKEELHVFAGIGKNEVPGKTAVKKISKSSHFLLRYLPQLAIDGERPVMSERYLDTCYACGEGAPQVNDESQVEDSKLHTYTFHIGEFNTAVADKEKDDVQSVSDYWVATEVLPVHVSMPGSSGTLREEGLKMHAMFGMIKGERDFDWAFNYAKNSGMLSDNIYWNEERVLELFETIKASEQLSSWFDDDNICYNERNISFPGKDGIDHRRPDRIVKRSNGEIIIVDYKFGYSFRSSTIANHTSQVHDYLQLLNQLGENNVKGYVWYVRSGKIVDVKL